MGYTFIAYVGLFLENSSTTQQVIEEVKKIAEVTVAHLTTGKFSIFCKIRAKDTMHAKEIIFKLDRIQGIKRTETSISLEEVINDKKRLMHQIFKEIAF
jgi:Lrp/AsnC family transcriptional regulator for asnA, asnC and gidA